MAKGKAGLRFTGSWKEFERLFKKSKHKAVLNKHLNKATHKVGRLVRKEMRNVIVTGRFRKNANLTIAIKHHNRPLLHSTSMHRSVTYRMVSNTSVFIGILKADEDYEKAKTVHGFTKDGAMIPVSDAMRAMFGALAAVSRGDKGMTPDKLTGRAAELWKANPGKWYPISKSTNFIRIRPRPFVRHTVMQRRVQKQAAHLWVQGMQNAYDQITQKVNRRR